MSPTAAAVVAVVVEALRLANPNSNALSLTSCHAHRMLPVSSQSNVEILPQVSSLIIYRSLLPR